MTSDDIQKTTNIPDL